MSIKSFVAGAATIALPVALVMGIMHFTHEWPVIAVQPPVLVRQIVLHGHCMKPPLPLAPAKRRHTDDGAP